MNQRKMKMKNKGKNTISIGLGLLVGMTVVMPFYIFESGSEESNLGDNSMVISSDEIELITENNCVVESASENEFIDTNDVTENIATFDDNESEYSFDEDTSSVEIEPSYLLIFDPLDLSIIPEYSGESYVILNNNIPYFTNYDLLNPAFEYYSDLDELGRCGVCTANVCKELMPTEDRGSIGQVKPSGWQTVKYPDLIPDLYLYNRCHLIAFCLTGENANVNNLITGTRYLNMTGMLQFEEMILDYVNETDNHVLYRVTPCFKDDELVARGVHMEGYSVEDNGLGICFNVFAYNVQPGISIDYSTGESWITED